MTPYSRGRSGELVQVDIEFRTKAREPCRFEDYLARFPELAADPHAAQSFRHAEAKRQNGPDGPRAEPNPPLPAGGVADRNLLFGILALQMDFISRDGLIAGMNAWVLDKKRPLAAILVEQGHLTAEHRDLLEPLVAAHLKRHDNDAEKSLAALSSVVSVQRDLGQLADPDVAASLGHLSIRKGEPGDSTATYVPYQENARVGRFRILRAYAKGGLGMVSVALDEELHREVAFKEILRADADNATSRERFVAEAEITGGLEHPGIVPVYGLGQYADGRPFYAMRFIRGDSLKTALEAYHRADNPNRKDPGVAPVGIASATGPVHRHLQRHRIRAQPGRAAPGFEAWQCDAGEVWGDAGGGLGLGKGGGEEEITSDEGTLRPSSALSSSGRTQPGSAIGTPAYMRVPNRPRGRLDQIGPATDIYGLGATLYHVLTGKPPFEKEELGAILEKVQRGEFPKPRAVVPDVPRAPWRRILPEGDGRKTDRPLSRRPEPGRRSGTLAGR